MAHAVETLGLERRFKTLKVVKNLSITVPAKAVYGFLGCNGAGKTTTLKMLLGLLRPTSGTAYICGVDVVRDRIGASMNVGALLEAHGFYTNLTGHENLDITRTLLGLPAKEVDRVLEVVEMGAHAQRRVGEYSLGMRQRLGLARAMLGAPRVLVLDEPTNGLDPDGIADMRHFLRDLPNRTGATVLLSSHLLGEIEQSATHVGIIHEGQLVLEGDLSALKADLAPEIVLRVADMGRAIEIIRSRGLYAGPSDGQLVVSLKSGADIDVATAALNRALVEAGEAVFAIGPRPRTLEGLYRSVTHSGSATPEAGKAA